MEIRLGATAESPKVAGHGLAVGTGWGWGILLDVGLGGVLMGPSCFCR